MRKQATRLCPYEDSIDPTRIPMHLLFEQSLPYKKTRLDILFTNDYDYPRMKEWCQETCQGTVNFLTKIIFVYNLKTNYFSMNGAWYFARFSLSQEATLFRLRWA
jgi:hypothetical protein